jgi:hypothetical protein
MANVTPAESAQSELPESVPAEVAALGKPERVYLPDEKQFKRNRTLVRVFFGGCGLLLAGLALTAGFLGAYKPDPTGTLRVVPLVLVGLSLPFFMVALWFGAARWGDAWWGPRTFLVYPDALVELRGGRHRIIPWKTIGALLPTAPLLDPHRFAVQSGGPLSFGSSVRDHEALCDTIKQRARGRGAPAAGWSAGHSMGDEAARAELAAAVPTAHFLARQLGGGVFRVTLLGKKLLFNRMKEGDGAGEPRANVAPLVTMGMAGGLISGFNTWAATARRKAFLEEKAALDRADADTLVRYAAAVEGSFALAPEEVRTLDIDPPSLLKHLFKGLDGTRQACLIKLAHARFGELTLELLSDEDTLTAIKELPQLVGAAVCVNVTYSYSQCAFVAK